MKKFSLLVAVATTLIFSSCGNSDDLSIWKELNKHSDQIENHEKRIETLEETCNNINNEISSLRAIVNAQQANIHITNITPIIKGGQTTGYTITFSDGNIISIYLNTNSTNSGGGYTPQIGIDQDTDGVYYWTLDGDWLLDSNGNKVKAVGTDGKDGQDGQDGQNGEDGQNGANGKDGVTPKLKIENDYWYVSYDDGKTWTKLGKATGEDGQDGSNGSNSGDSLFKSVTQDEDNVYFTLSDGTVITLAKISKDEIEKILKRIQSVSYIPTYSDGKATVRNSVSSSNVTFDFEVSPKEAVTELAKIWSSAISVKAVYTQTRAVSFINMPIVSFEADSRNGVITVTASGENLSQEFFNGTQEASARLAISDGNNSITSEYIALVAIKKAVPNNEIWYTNGSTTTATTPYDKTAFDANIVSNTYDSQKKCWILKFDGEVSKIGSNAFYNRSNLTSITIPDSITTCGEDAFSGCTSLKRVNISNLSAWCKITFETSATASPLYNGADLYIDGKRAVDITIPSDITDLPFAVFFGCTSIESVTIPSSVTSLHVRMFQRCSSLAAFYGKYASDDHCCLIINNKLISSVSAGLVNYTIPNNVTSIYFGAFCDCTSLESVTIPNSVTEIGSTAFYGCSSLKTVYCKPTIPPTGEEGMFDDNASGRIIYVPRNSVSAYKTASYWSGYSSSISGHTF